MLPQLPPAAAINPHVGRQIAYRQKALGLTDREIEERVGVEARALASFKNGERAVPTPDLYGLSRCLQTSTETFFAGLPGMGIGVPSVAHFTDLENVTSEVMALVNGFYALSMADRKRVMKVIERLYARQASERELA